MPHLLLLAAAASAADHSFHVAGYGETGFSASVQEGGGAAFQGVTFAPILLWRYGDRVLVESELAFGYTAEGFAADLEYFDVQVDVGAVLYAGKFLTPVGQFTSRLHPAWINRFPDFPLPYRLGIAPMTHVGAGLQHAVRLGPSKVGATVFVDNGPVYSDGEPLLDPQVGADENADKGVGGRVGVLPIPSVEVGGSWYTAAYGGDASARYTLLVADAAFTHGGWLDVRGEYLHATWGDQAFDGAWAQAGWRLRQVPMLARLEPVVRFGWAQGDTITAVAHGHEEEEAAAKSAGDADGVAAGPKSVGHGGGPVELGDDPAWELCYGLDYWLRTNVVLKGTFTHGVEAWDPRVGVSFGMGF